jgi:hypothetical protein
MATAPATALAPPHVAHNGGEQDWYTPAPFVEAAREVMGGIDLDPASSEVANRVVGAARYYDAGQDGLENVWHGQVWLTPPTPPRCWTSSRGTCS